MNHKLRMLLCALLVLCFLLSACTQVTDPDTPQADAEQTIQSITESDTEQETTGEDTTEQETEPPVEIQVPEGEIPDLTALLAGPSDVLTQQFDMSGKTVSQLKSESLTFVNGSLFQKSDKGLTTNNTGWDSVGYSKPISTDTYTLEAQFTVAPNDRGGPFNAAMVGLYCKTSQNLFIDGGLWFSFRENQASVYVKQGMEKVISTNLPFSARDGIHFCAKGDRNGAQIYANDTLIATVEIGEKLIVKDADGSEVASCALDNVSVNGNGYFRYMSHYANSTLTSMTVQGETKRIYTPEKQMIAFSTDLSYAFAEKVQYLCAIPTTSYSGVTYADAAVLAKVLGFTYEQSCETLLLKRDGVTLEFEPRQAQVAVNGEVYAFPTAVYTKQTFMLPVAAMGQMLGYAVNDQDNITVLSQNNNVQEAMTMAKDTYDLYQSVIYNYDDVACDQTGVGLFEQTPYEERLVGIAYTTWHTASRNWGAGTWDLPLCGPYLSDDETVLRYHAELLRDAGVDFVFVDWSNNTNYDPATMRDKRADFRMIEEATDKMFDVWATVEGAPKICIFLGPGHTGQESVDNGNHQKKADQVWRDYVTNPDRADLYFNYEGKPLVICYGATPTQYGADPAQKWDDDRFTVRWITGYVGQQTNLFKGRTLQSKLYWSWEERGAQTYTVLNGKVEAVTVSAATRPQGNEGSDGYIPASGRENGATFKRQFQRACDLGAGIVLIVSWNEWTTGEQPTVEISKDIEPSQVHGTFYYDLMREQIKKFKGQIPKSE